MKIYLFLDKKIMSFSLPDMISGSYSFGENISDEDKLINLEAREGKWVLYSTESSKIKQNNSFVDSIEVKADSYYYISKDSKDYLIYITSIENIEVELFNCADSFYLSIGNEPTSNINYNCEIINGTIAKLNIKSDSKLLEVIDNKKVYLNNIRVEEPSIYFQSGDIITIFGLKIIFFDKYIILYYPKNKITISNITGFSKKTLDISAEYKNIIIRDKNLYDPENYFTKSPRIRRIIEEKEIKLSDPPHDGNKKNNSFLVTIGPMLTMGMSSIIMLINGINQVKSGNKPISQSWPSLASSGLMLISMLVWPIVSRLIIKRLEKKEKQELIEKYTEYLVKKEQEIIDEAKLQKEILHENLITLDDCLNMAKTRQFPFWNRRTDQNDFLTVRIGYGQEKLKIKLSNPPEGFSIEESELQTKVNNLREKYKYITDVPVGYSFYDNNVTAVMGEKTKSAMFIHNILLQFISFYSYEDIKIVVLTSENDESNWEYLKYLKHNFTNNMDFRFFSSNNESTKLVLNYLENEFNVRESEGKPDKDYNIYSPYYIIIIDDYNRVKRYEFIKKLSEQEDNYGFSLILNENRLNRLPSKCNNFISIGEKTSGILKNAFEKQEQSTFYDEVKNNIDMMDVARSISNIPIEFSNNEEGQLPESLSFLEMEKIGKVEQLNIFNRWKTNDSTSSLKAEVGVNNQNDIIYLDLHEKYHGPHGLIAGMTGSGKSEFIITYILSMAINYSPNDVSFILIDYKGGGLAFAFENKVTNKILPHLAGTITNLDKAEMDRTLVSINSELQRRQKMFNEARDQLGESTIDIYKYQRFYKEGKIKEPISHLFIICDEFAELKSQQPDFMDSLISTARIGRSLGVHLILATQKPSGVVNDQIWSNTKFRVCLKVQDTSDSNEMLKRPEAASIKETGRFFLQVGYNEYFTLGQSAWCGAKYFPSDKIVKTVDKSINYLNDCGQFIKSVQASASEKKTAHGEQISAIMDIIIETSKLSGITARRLWLENIPATILLDDIEKKYSVTYEPYNVKAIIGEYDAPEQQKQDIVTYNYIDDGNALIYGNDSIEREMLLKSLIYSTAKNYSSDEVNFYIVDYGSESLRVFNKLPHFGGSVYIGEEEKLTNLIKLLTKEIDKRKKKFSNYGGEYKNYISQSNEKLPLYVVIFNNYDSIHEANQYLYDVMPNITRDSERYGIVYMLTVNGISSVGSKLGQNFNYFLAYKLKDLFDYNAIFTSRKKMLPRDILGRGICYTDDIHEFQTTSIVNPEEDVNKYLTEFVENVKNKNKNIANVIPELPNIVSQNYVSMNGRSVYDIPVGINKSTLEVVTYNFNTSPGNVIQSNKIENMFNFTISLLMQFSQLQNSILVIFDPDSKLNLNRQAFKNYLTSNFDAYIGNLISLIESQSANPNKPFINIVINQIDKLLGEISDSDKTLLKLMEAVKTYEKATVTIIDSKSKIKLHNTEQWFTKFFSINDGIWIGKGISEQSLFRISAYNKEMTQSYKNDMGFIIVENECVLVKLIDFITKEGDSDDK